MERWFNSDTQREKHAEPTDGTVDQAKGCEQAEAAVLLT